MFRLIVILFSLALLAASDIQPAVTQPIPITQIAEYSSYPLVVQKLISKAQQLSQMNLTYMYGSADPKNKGMDCSGTIYYLLTLEKLSDIPRSSDEQYNWVKKLGTLHSVMDQNFNSAEFAALQPGDLLFWTGTYATKSKSQISHVMIYLGKNKNGERLMFGSSDGRTYQGKKMWGVSVFDFNLPDGKGSQRFVGYSCIPDLTCDKGQKPKS